MNEEEWVIGIEEDWGLLGIREEEWLFISEELWVI